MKNHLVREDTPNLTLNLYRIDEKHLTIMGEMNPDSPTPLVELITKRDSGSSQTYNINLTDISQFKNKDNYSKNTIEKHCIICGEQQTNLIYNKYFPIHHYHEECHQQLIEQIQELIDNNSTLLTKNQI